MSVGYSRDELKLKLLEIDSTLANVCSEDAPKSAKDSERTNDLVYGVGAVATVQLHDDKIISLTDAPNLIRWVLTDGSYLPWALVQRKPLIQKCVVIYISGIDVQLWEEHRGGALKSLAQLFGNPITTVARHPTTTAVQSVGIFLKVPVSQRQRQQRSKESGDKRPKKRQKQRSSVPCSYEDLLATSHQRMEYGMPHESESIFQNKGYVTTPIEAESKQRLVALDCEMCETALGSELTRMSLVDENGEVLADTLVKPHMPITDYRTPFSGITEEMMTSTTTDLAKAQELFFKYVSYETILVGHSLENDLAAMKIFHAKLIDSSMIYPHPSGFPRRSSLKYLARRYLGKTIQAGSHDSIMDARIALELVKLKKREGLEFGVPRHEPTQLTKLTEMLGEQQRVSCMVDRSEVIQRHSAATTHAIPCESDALVLQRLLPQLKKNHDFIWAQFQDLYRFYIARNSSDLGLAESDAEVGAVLSEIDRRICRIHEEAPTQTMLMVVTGHGDTSLAIKTQSDKARREAGLDNLPRWTEGDEDEWAALSSRVVQGLLFATVKSP